ncbi:MAG: CvpA family protein [Candidatus Cloacimonadia bacterium]
MNIVNLIALGLIIFLGIRGLKRGFFDGITRLVGWLIALIIAVQWGPKVSEFFKDTFELPAAVINIIGIVLIFIVVIILLNLIVNLIKKVVTALRLSSLDKILGFLLGAAKALILIFLITFTVQWLPLSDKNKKVITDAEVIKWNNKSIAYFLATTNLDTHIKNNKYYKQLAKKTQELKEEIETQPTP